MFRVRSISKKLYIAPVLVFVIVFAALMWAGCASRPEPKPAMSAQGVRTVLIMDFVDAAKVYGPDQGVRSPVSSQAFITGPVDKDACQFMTSQMLNFIGEKTDFVPVPFEDAQGALSQLLAENGTNLLSADKVCDLGRAIGVDAVVVGHVYRFQERVGTSYSVDTPASVAFDVHMLRVADQGFIWSCRYDETQKALSDNLLDFSKFIKRGGAWVTARKLASLGLNKALSSFPKP